MEDLASKRAQNSSFGGTSSLQPAIFETDFKIAERGEQKSNKGKIEQANPETLPLKSEAAKNKMERKKEKHKIGDARDNIARAAFDIITENVSPKISPT